MACQVMLAEVLGSLPMVRETEEKSPKRSGSSDSAVSSGVSAGSTGPGPFPAMLTAIITAAATAAAARTTIRNMIRFFLFIGLGASVIFFTVSGEGPAGSKRFKYSHIIELRKVFVKRALTGQCKNTKNRASRRPFSKAGGTSPRGLNYVEKRRLK